MVRLLGLLLVCVASIADAPLATAQDVAIRWVRPTSAPVGTPIRISGTNLDRARFVTVGGMRVPIESATSTRLTIRMPGQGGELRLWGATGPVADGPALHVVGDALRLVELDPPLADRGQVVVVRVENLEAPYAIDFGGERVVRSSSVMPPSFTVPEVAESGDVVVHAANGVIRARLELHPRLSVERTPELPVRTFHPNDTVVVEGQGFVAPMRVRMSVTNGEPISASATIISATRLRVRMPALPEGAHSGSLSLVDRVGRERDLGIRVTPGLAFDPTYLHAARGMQCTLQIRGRFPLERPAVFVGDDALEVIAADRATIVARLRSNRGRCRTPRRIRIVVDGTSHDVNL